VTKTDTGVSKTYEGTRTNPEGDTVNVSSTKDLTKTSDGVTVERTHTLTDESGQTLKSGASTTVKNEDGVNTTYEGSRTNKEGFTTTVTGERSGTWTEDGFQGEGSRTIVGPEGQEYYRTYDSSGSYQSQPSEDTELGEEETTEVE